MELQNVLRDKVISSISTMDVRMLDVLLPEYGNYEGTYKEVWLSKLSSFFKMCRLKGDNILTVIHKPCAGGFWCECEQMMWLFESEHTGKGFAIYVEMDGDEIVGIQRCYGHYVDDLDTAYFNESFDFEGFYVYSHEKIGFIDSYELKELRKDVLQFMADMMNTRRRSMGVIGIKRKVFQYFQLYLDAKEVPCLFEYRIEMLQLYEDLFAIKNMLTQQKGFQLVLHKCRELMQCTDTKSKVKVLKWFLRNQSKVSQYLVNYFTLQIEETRIVYHFHIHLTDYRLVIRHPNIRMDVEACSMLQSYIKLFFNYLQYIHVKTIGYGLNVDPKRKLYHYFKDKMEEVLTPCELWISGVVGGTGVK